MMIRSLSISNESCQCTAYHVIIGTGKDFLWKGSFLWKGGILHKFERKFGTNKCYIENLNQTFFYKSRLFTVFYSAIS